MPGILSSINFLSLPLSPGDVGPWCRDCQSPHPQSLPRDLNEHFFSVVSPSTFNPCPRSLYVCTESGTPRALCRCVYLWQNCISVPGLGSGWLIHTGRWGLGAPGLPCADGRTERKCDLSLRETATLHQARCGAVLPRGRGTHSRDLEKPLYLIPLSSSRAQISFLSHSPHDLRT